MSQAEPYVVVRRSSSGVQQGRSFATKRAAIAYAKKHGYNTVAQKRKGHAGLTVVETIDTGRRVTITRKVNDGPRCLYGKPPGEDCGARACPVHGTPSGSPYGERRGAVK